MLNIDGHYVKDTQQICDSMADHMRQVFSDKDEDHYDNEFKADIEERVTNLKRVYSKKGSVCKDLYTTKTEIEIVCRGLANKKAPGVDGITYEHLKYGGSNLYTCLANLFNRIIDSGIIPSAWKLGVVIPIYKGGGKPKTSPDSYRGVSLLPVIFKLFETIVDKRIHQFQRFKHFPNNHQCGFQKGLSSTHASFSIQEVAAHYIEQGDSLKAVLLDSTKAFDTVWHSGLLWKLHEMKIQEPIWKILSNCYEGMKSCILINDKKSYWFDLERGVRQGGVLSAKLYLVYINELLQNLAESQKGAMILDVHVAAPTQADDITLLSPITTNLQAMTDICVKYSSIWRFTFSASKSAVMSFGKRETAPVKISLYGSDIPYIHETKHLGIKLNNKLHSWDRTIEACSKLKSTSIALIKHGFHSHALNPLTSFKLYQSICLPRCLYGCELWCNLNKGEMQMLERAQRFAMKIAQGLPRCTRSDICNALLGVLPIEAHIDKQKLLLFGRLCHTKRQNISSQIFLTRLFFLRYTCSGSSLGFIPDIRRLLHKYDLQEQYQSFLTTGIFMSYYSWKSKVKITIKQYEERQWATRMDEDPDLKHFKLIHPRIQPHIAWLVHKSFPSLKPMCRLVVQLCACWRPGKVTGQCNLCHELYSDLLVHTVCICPGTLDIRERLWCDIADCTPIEISVLLHNQSDTELVSSLLSCRPPLKLSDEETINYALIIITNIALFNRRVEP